MRLRDQLPSVELGSSAAAVARLGETTSRGVQFRFACPGALCASLLGRFPGTKCNEQHFEMHFLKFFIFFSSFKFLSSSFGGLHEPRLSIDASLLCAALLLVLDDHAT